MSAHAQKINILISMVTAVNCVCAFEGHAHFSLTLSQRKLPSRVLDNGGPDNRTVLHFYISNS